MSFNNPDLIKKNDQPQNAGFKEAATGVKNLFENGSKLVSEGAKNLLENKWGKRIGLAAAGALLTFGVSVNPAFAGQNQFSGSQGLETLAQGVNMEEVANQVKGILDEYKVDSSLLQFSVISGNIVVEAKNNYGNNNVDAFESDDQNAATEINTAMRQLGNDQKRKVFGSVGIQEKLTQQNQNNTTPAFQNIPQVTPTQPSIVNPAGQGIVVPQQQNSGNGNFFN